MKQIVLTVDDRLIYNYTIIAPILKQYGFRCTFFITAKPNIWHFRGYSDMNWEQCQELYEDGFEIGNHTFSHFPITCGLEQFEKEIIFLNDFLRSLGIEKPVSFAYPGYLHEPHLSPLGQEILKKLGFKYARVGYPVDQWHYNISKREYTSYFNPKGSNALEILTTGILNKDYTFEHFKSDIDKMPDNHVAVFSTHFAQSPYEINRLHQICRYIRDHQHCEMVCLKDLGIE